MMKILIVEDDELVRDMLSRHLQRKSYTVVVARNGEEAISVSLLERPNLILMDLNMPIMDGLEATRRIVEQWGDLRPMIIAMTANALQSDKENYLAAGMDDYISKPITLDQIKMRIEKWAIKLNLDIK